MEGRFFSGNKKLGILGGGQLGKMLLQCTRQWDIQTKVLDPDAEAPSRYSCNEFVQGSLTDFDTVYQFGKDCDVLTIEIENVNVDALLQLEREGVVVHPKPSSLQVIQDKGLQKQFFADHNIPSTDFSLYEHKAALQQALQNGSLQYPFVQKTRKAGYDGRGVAVIDSAADLDKLLEGPCLAEGKVELNYELAVIACRNSKGEVTCFDPVYMDVHPEANLLDLLLYPAPVTERVREQTRELAARLIEQFGICGVLAVEFLVDGSDTVWVNEVAPRPHNSGHQTIENSVSSQYEQHIRGILNLAPGSTAARQASAMVNLLGAEGHEGAVYYEGLETCLEREGVYVHIYGKKKTKPFRKMGHVTVTAADTDTAKQTALWVKEQLKVISL